MLTVQPKPKERRLMNIYPVLNYREWRQRSNNVIAMRVPFITRASINNVQWQDGPNNNAQQYIAKERFICIISECDVLRSVFQNT